MTTSQIRLLGLTLERVAEFRTRPAMKNSGLYAALDRRYGVVDVVRPVLSRAEEYFNRLHTVNLDRIVWRQRRALNTWAFQRRSAHAERMLDARAGEYDLIVQLHTIFAPGLAPERRRYVLHTDNTYLISERHFAPWAPLPRRERADWLAFERRVYQNAQFVFPRSQFLRRSLIEDYGCDPERVVVVGGGTNYQAIDLAEKRYDQQTALFVGYDFERKGGMVLLKAWELVRRRLPEAQLWIVGPKKPVRELPGVHWLHRIDDRAALARRYREATLFVLPSIFEPWGQVFFEAMSLGLPCIGSTCCAMGEVIQDGVTGLLAATGQAEPLADALVALLGDPRRAEAMGRAANQYVAQGHTWDDVVERMSPYIEQAVGAPAAAVQL